MKVDTSDSSDAPDYWEAGGSPPSLSRSLPAGTVLCPSFTALPPEYFLETLSVILFSIHFCPPLTLSLSLSQSLFQSLFLFSLFPLPFLFHHNL